jgi:putative methyltransferase (TIGR04325 family)
MTVKDLIRPITCRIPLVRRLQGFLSPPPKVTGHPSHTAYPSFEAAMAECPGRGGYNDAEFADVMFKKTRALAAGRVRDAVHDANAVATLEALQLARATRTRVLDFGGNCGLHYFLAKQETGQAFKWAVVEMPLIMTASAPLETEELRFFTDIDSALEWLDGKPALVHSSGAIQYTPEPEMFLSKLVEIEAACLAILRKAVALGPRRVTVQTSRLRDNGPGELPPGVQDREVRYPLTFISRTSFRNIIGYRYRLVYSSRDDRMSDWVADGVRCQHGDNGVFAITS